MCGIIGMWCHHSEDMHPRQFIRARDTLFHRGPDESGVFHDPSSRIHLGHRRLAILDPSPAGVQPMWTDDARLAIVYNGGVYNFVELREQLSALGHRFRSGTDTEVILAGFREWGTGVQPRLNGMWAFVIWDALERRLFASRDRFGVKPLLYRATRDSFAFASELKAFAALPDVAMEIDAATLTFSPMVTETLGATLMVGVRSLPPGHSLVVTSDGRAVEERWWNTVEHLPTVATGYADQVDGFRALFEDACRIRLRSDVPLGTSLSGGLDSSAVLSMVHHAGGQEGFTADWQRAFSQGYPGSDQDESYWASLAARHVGADLTWTSIDPDSMLDRLEESILSFEQIHMVPLGLWAHYRALREQGVVISLDGHGGDELLGGYLRFTTAMRQRSLSRLQPSLWREYAEIGLGLEGKNPTRSLQLGVLRDDIRSLVAPSMVADRARGFIGQSLPLRVQEALRRQPGNQAIIADIVGVRELQERIRTRDARLREEVIGLDPLGRILYRAFHHTVLPSILRNFDRLSMASGIEIRAPLLDWRVVTYSFALPGDAKIGGGTTKRILRDSVRGLLPEKVRLRRDKKGFASPLSQWLSGGLGAVAGEVVNDAAFVERPLWDGPRVRDRITAGIERSDWGAVKRDWSFVQTELLIRGFERIAREARAA
jgi:asparagine synthase (glutamine-hydrolysing)